MLAGPKSGGAAGQAADDILRAAHRRIEAAGRLAAPDPRNPGVVRA